MTFHSLVMLLKFGFLRKHFRIELQSKFRQHFAGNAQKNNFEMNKVYFRNTPGSAELQISFHFKNLALKVDREFKFCRNVSEKVDDAIVRIRANIEKEVNKKSKKKNKSKSQETSSVAQNVTVDFMRNDAKVTSVTFAQMIEDVEDLRMQVLDKKYDVVVNTPWVCTLTLPQSILAGFILYPNKIELQFADQNHCIGTWFRGKMPSSKNVQQIDWIKCGTGLSYNTSIEDIGYHIKFELQPGNANGLGPSVEAIGKNEVEAGPGKCPFEERHLFTKNHLDGNRFRVVSYNILADLYADSDYSRTTLFPYCPPYALRIDYRKQLFIKEILGYNGDLVCLQEVDVKVFDLDLKPILQEKGYGTLFHQKGHCGEGLATFYRSERFELIRTSALNIGANIPTLPVFRTLWEKFRTNNKLVDRLVDRATTLQLTILKSKETNKILLVANTHLYFHPDADHIRLLQIGFSMLYIENIIKNLVNELEVPEDEICLIFCGDFNSVPECGIYKLMTERFVDSDNIDWSSNLEEAVKDVALSQPFNMASACGTPEYTNYTHLFAACLDYIFYQKDRLDVEEVVPLPSEDELKAHIAIPSVQFPSDHVALVANLKFKT